MFIEVWTAKSHGGMENWTKSQELWKKGSEIIKKHPAVLDCRVFRSLGNGNNAQLFSMYMFDSIEKQQEFWKNLPDGFWENMEEAEQSGTYDLSDLGNYLYNEV